MERVDSSQSAAFDAKKSWLRRLSKSRQILSQTPSSALRSIPSEKEFWCFTIFGHNQRLGVKESTEFDCESDWDWLPMSSSNSPFACEIERGLWEGYWKPVSCPRVFMFLCEWLLPEISGSGSTNTAPNEDLKRNIFSVFLAPINSYPSCRTSSTFQALFYLNPKSTSASIFFLFLKRKNATGYPAANKLDRWESSWWSSRPGSPMCSMYFRRFFSKVQTRTWKVPTEEGRLTPFPSTSVTS